MWKRADDPTDFKPKGENPLSLKSKDHPTICPKEEGKKKRPGRNSDLEAYIFGGGKKKKKFWRFSDQDPDRSTGD